MDLRFRKPLLYPAELRDLFKQEMTNVELQIYHSSFIIRHFKKSGWQDSNLRPSAPKADALAGLRYTPILFFQKNIHTGGEGGI